MGTGETAEKVAEPEENLKPRSISRRLTLSLVLTIIIVATATSASIYWHASQRQEKDLGAKADEYLSYLVGTLEVPLWNVDERTIRVIVNTVSQNELIVRLAIKDHKGNVVHQFKKKQNGTQQLNRSGKIMHRGKLLGEVAFSLTSKFHQDSNRKLILSYGISFLFIIFTLILVTGFWVRTFLKKPLERLNTIVAAYAHGIYNSTATRLPYQEFEPLEQVLTQMGNKIQSQMDELKQTMAALRQANDDMELQVADRTVELQTAKEKAETASRAKSAFLSSMSHELRTPLNAILGFAQLISRNQSLPAEQKEQIELINRSGGHLLALINHVLDMSKIEAGHAILEEHGFDLLRLIGEVEQIFRTRAVKQGLQFNTEVSPAAPRYVVADEVKLRQVLINLLSNAFKYTARGGVALKVQSRTTTGFQDVSDDDPHAERDAPAYQVCFAVEDSGPGISSGDLDDVFEAFVQTDIGKRRQVGTGLGLSLSKEFATLMGGRLSVQSTVGKGSVFSFEIPVQSSSADQIESTHRRPRVVGLAPGQPRYRILIVDDVKSSRRLVAETLYGVSSPKSSEPGFDVRQAADGQQALEIWKRWKPHLIWMDMRMPVLNGYEATRRIKSDAQGNSTRIIGLSASAFEEQRSAVLSAGCDDFLRKPFKISDFFTIMRQQLGVRYVYDTDFQENADFVEPPEKIQLTAASLSRVPASVINALHQAVKETNPVKTEAAIALIAKQHHQLVSELNKLTADFRFDRLRELLEELK